MRFSSRSLRVLYSVLDSKKMSAHLVGFLKKAVCRGVWLGSLKDAATGQKAGSSVSESLKSRKDPLEANAALAAALRSAPQLP